MHQIATDRDGLSFLFFYAIQLTCIVDKLSARNLPVHISWVTLLENLNNSIRQKLYSCDAVKPWDYLLKAQSNRSNASTVRISMTDRTM
jgi:hypothetical protein